MSIVLSVLGINYGRVRNILVKRIGGAKVKQLEIGFDLMQRLASGGLAAAVQHVMQLGQTLKQLQTTVIESVRNWVIETVVRAAISKLVATFSGFGAVAVAVQGIYNAIAFLIEQANKIQALVDAVAASLGNIVTGKVSQATNYIESTLARGLSVAISFLARIVGLGNVGKKVREIIERVQARVDAALNKLVDLVVEKGNSWLKSAGGRTPNNAAGGSGRPGSQKPVGGQGNGKRKPNINFVKTFEMAGQGHHLYVNGKNNKLSVTMASVNPEDLKKLVDGAILRESSNGTQTKQELLKQLREINEYLMGTIFPLYEKFDFSNDQQKNEYSMRLNGLVSEIKDIGKKFSIGDLRDVAKKPSAQMVKEAIESKTIVPFLKEIAEGKTVLGVDRSLFVRVFRDRNQLINRKPAAEWIENKFRGVEPGTHEWILTKLLPEVVERAASSKKTAWIDLQNEMRSDTSWIVFKPSRITTTEVFKGQGYNVYHGHPGALKIDKADKVKGQYEFHQDLENQFKISNTPNLCIQNVQKVFKTWVWDGTEALRNVHPELELDGMLVQPNLVTITQNQKIRFNKMNEKFNNLKNKY